MFGHKIMYIMKVTAKTLSMFIIFNLLQAKGLSVVEYYQIPSLAFSKINEDNKPFASYVQ